MCLQAAQQRQKRYADEHRIEVQYEIGQLVWLNSQHVTTKAVGSCKMLPRWLGPFKILAKPSPINTTLDIPPHCRIHTTFHVSMLRRAYNNGAGAQRPPNIMIEGQEEFDVQEVLNHSPAQRTGVTPTLASLCSGKALVMFTIVGNLVVLSRRMHLKCCLTTGMKLKLCKCKQLSLELTLTLGWPLVIKSILPLRAEVLAEAVVETVVVLQVGVVVEV